MKRAVPILFFDFGNSRVKWSIDGQTQMGVSSYEEFPGCLSRLSQEIAIEQQVVASFVTSKEREQQYLALVASYFSVPQRVCRVLTEALGMRCGYRDPAKLGVDRWLAVLAVWHQFHGAALVVDLGTAATLDAVDDSGQHLGGFIVSGLKLATAGLLAGTDKIAPAMEQDCFQMETARSSAAPLSFGKSTQEAVEWGALCSLTAMVEHLYHQLLSVWPSARLVITGGDEPLVGARLGFDYDRLQGLVFQGMAALVEADLTLPVNSGPKS